MTRTLFVSLVALLSLGDAASAQTTSTLSLDGASYVSFGNQQLFSIPLGSSVVFEFGAANPDGSVPFTISPSGVTIQPIPMSGQYRDLRYTLESSASGIMAPTATGRRIDFTAPLRATLVTQEGEIGSFSYAIPMTTETAEVQNIAGDLQLEVSGFRLIDGIWYLQLVGGVTNKENAFPEPGTAVYTFLSGTFDQVPQ